MYQLNDPQQMCDDWEEDEVSCGREATASNNTNN